MKKFTSTDLGGAPVTKEDLRVIFGSQLWSVIEAFLYPFISDTEGVIVSGCVISGSGPYNMTDGVVFLNGEFMYMPTQTGFTLPKYIQPDSPVDDVRTFADATTHTVAVTKQATIGASAPGGSQYISITTTDDPDDRRWAPRISSARRFDVTANTNSGGTATTIITIPRVANKTMRIDARMVSSHVSGSDAAGSGSSAYKAAKYKDVSGTGTIIGSINDIDSDETGANAPVLTFTVSGTNLLVTAQAGSGEVYKVRIVADVIEI